MQTLVIASAVHQTACEFVNDNDLALFVYDIFSVTLHYAVSLDSLIDMVLDRDIIRVGQVINSEEFLCLLYAHRGKGCCLCLFVNDIVDTCFDIFLIVVFLCVCFCDPLAFHGLCKLVSSLIEVGGLIALT